MGAKARVTTRTKALKVIRQPTLLCFMAKRSEGDSSLGGARQRASTATSDFGVSKRESHDSSTYYNSRMNANLASSRDVGLPQDLPEQFENVLLQQDARSLPLPDNCIQLVVTSPPYNASKVYDDDLSLQEYLQLLEEVFSECYRVLSPGGRMVVNVANLGRKPYIPLSTYINNIMLNLGFLMRGEVIWDKSASAGSSCAWGSFQSASNPCLRDIHEYLLVFSKGDYKMPRSKKERENGRIDTIEKQEFIDHTKSIWRFATERKSCQPSCTIPPSNSHVDALSCTRLQVMSFLILSMVLEQHVLQQNKQVEPTLELICHPSIVRLRRNASKLLHSNCPNQNPWLEDCYRRSDFQ